MNNSEKVQFLFSLSETEKGTTGEFSKGPAKLIQRVKITDSFPQSESNQFHIILLIILHPGFLFLVVPEGGGALRPPLYLINLISWKLQT